MRLIDADALTKKLQHLWNIHDDVDFNNKDVWDELAFAPTVDAVEVVRCRDCKHWVKDGNDSYGYAMFCKANCSLGGQGIKKPDDYCSYGERKVDG